MTDQISIEDAIGQLLIRREWTLTTAESCTGGGIGNRITSISGSSEYYLGGIIAYHNTVKQICLGVSPQILESYGAVSHKTAELMAHGVRKIGGASVGLSVTGIAGPTGGTEEKPVGTVYIGVASDIGTKVRHFVFPGNRQNVRTESENAAFILLHEHLIQEPPYEEDPQ